MRRERQAVMRGSYQPVMATGNLLLFARDTKAERILVALNLGSDPVSMSFPSEMLSGHILVSSLGDRDRERVRKTIDLRDNEGIVVELDSATVRP
jgi:alpha-glucosidase